MTIQQESGIWVTDLIDPSWSREAGLVVPYDAAVNHEAPAWDLLAAVTPGVPLHVTYWS